MIKINKRKCVSHHMHYKPNHRFAKLRILVLLHHYLFILFVPQSMKTSGPFTNTQQNTLNPESDIKQLLRSLALFSNVINVRAALSQLIFQFVQFYLWPACSAAPTQTSEYVWERHASELIWSKLFLKQDVGLWEPESYKGYKGL